MDKANKQYIPILIKKIKILENILVVLGFISYVAVYFCFSNAVLSFFIALVPAFLFAASCEITDEVKKALRSYEDK